MGKLRVRGADRPDSSGVEFECPDRLRAHGAELPLIGRDEPGQTRRAVAASSAIWSGGSSRNSGSAPMIMAFSVMLPSLLPGSVAGQRRGVTGSLLPEAWDVRPILAAAVPSRASWSTCSGQENDQVAPGPPVFSVWQARCWCPYSRYLSARSVTG